MIYEISRLFHVDNSELQGCLPLPIKPMQTRKGSNGPATVLVQVPFTARKRRSLKHDWQFLPFAWLDNFEQADRQFTTFGFEFEDAISVCPSNPKFLARREQIVLMPIKQGRSFKLGLIRPMSQVRLWVRGSQPVTVSALNAQGHCVAIAQTAELSSEDPALYPEQGMVIDVSTAEVLQIDSKAPFVLTRLASQVRRAV